MKTVSPTSLSYMLGVLCFCAFSLVEILSLQTHTIIKTVYPITITLSNMLDVLCFCAFSLPTAIPVFEHHSNPDSFVFFCHQDCFLPIPRYLDLSQCDLVFLFCGIAGWLKKLLVLFLFFVELVESKSPGLFCFVCLLAFRLRLTFLFKKIAKNEL